jgi:hypothetical protein
MARRTSATRSAMVGIRRSTPSSAEKEPQASIFLLAMRFDTFVHTCNTLRPWTVVIEGVGAASKGRSEDSGLSTRAYLRPG